MKKSKFAAIYPRKSRENADTLDSQLNACTEWCKNNNVEYEVFLEEGNASSEDWDRPELQRMIKKLKNLEFDLVVVTEQTRICRDDMFPSFKQILLDNNIIFVTVDTNQIIDFSNPDDELKSDILQAVGKNELARTKIRLKRGTVQSAKKGNWVGKKAPVGYIYDKKKKILQLSEDAEIIKGIFESYLNGMSTKNIALDLKFNNVHTKVKEIKWTPSGVARILKNVAYAGHSLFNKTTQKPIRDERGSKTKKRKTLATEEKDQIFIEDTHTPIINKEKFEAVQKLLLKNNNKPLSLRNSKHTFSGLILCSICGATHSFQKSKSGKKRISTCQTRNYNDDLTSYTICENAGCNLEDFEKLFYKWIGDHTEKFKKYKEKIKAVKITENNFKEKKEAQKAVFKTQIQKLQSRINKITDLIEEDYYDQEEEAEKKAQVKEMKLQIKRLANEMKEIEEEGELNENDQIEKIKNNMELFLKGKMTEKEANEILLKFIQHIKYKKIKKKIEIKVFIKQEFSELFKQIETI